MADYDDTADKSRGTNPQLARIERKQEYTHALLTGTMGVVAAATLSIAGSTAWWLAAAAFLAATFALAVNWKRTTRSIEAHDY